LADIKGEPANLVLHAMKVAILDKFDNVQRVCDGGLTERMILDRSYEVALQKVEEQFSRLIIGLEKIDAAEDDATFVLIAKRIMEIAEVDLTSAIATYLRSYLSAVRKAAFQ